jgi:hypothetical protein
MAEELNLSKQVYGTATYTKVIDTQFRQLVTPAEPEEELVTVDRFFELYEQLFFEIPVVGDVNSHEYLVRRSGEYIGGEVLSDNERALIDEINSLRQQLLEANKSIVDISSIT